MRTCLLVVAVLAAVCASAHAEHVNFVLVGATGNLAKKYLWQALFQLFSEDIDTTYSFYACARASKDDGLPAIQTMWDEGALRCKPSTDNTTCQARQEAFRAATTYFQLKNKDDYEALGKELANSDKTGTANTIFYLSIPPWAYSTIAGYINEFCRPKGGWLRVAIEKPFGRDASSAMEMAEELSRVLDESELYRIDHYIGKRGVQQILAFRQANEQHMGDLWTTEHIKQVEIVVKETEDCSGRTVFYDTYSVILDMMQNHMTEILTLLAMHLPREATPANILKAKADVLNHVQDIKASDVITAQYENYLEHLKADSKDETHHSDTATYASVVLNFRHFNRLDNIPFFITSGKQLDERRAFARVLFTRNFAAVSCPDEHGCVPSITFHIQGGDEGPATFVSRALPKPAVPPGWRMEETPRAWKLIPGSSVGAIVPYNALVADLRFGRQGSFVGTEALLRSWQIWSQAMNHAHRNRPRIYPAGSALSVVDDPHEGMRFLDREFQHGTHHNRHDEL